MSEETGLTFSFRDCWAMNEKYIAQKCGRIILLFFTYSTKLIMASIINSLAVPSSYRDQLYQVTKAFLNTLNCERVNLGPSFLNYNAFFYVLQGSSNQLTDDLSTTATLYVGNLSFFTTEEQIYELFGKCGEIKRIIMGLDRNQKTPCGFCFVE